MKEEEIEKRSTFKETRECVREGERREREREIVTKGSSCIQRLVFVNREISKLNKNPKNKALKTINL